MKNKTVRLLLAGILALTSTVAFGSVVNLDFDGAFSGNVYAGQGALVTADAHYWNAFALGNSGISTTSNPLLASDGTTATGYTVTLNDWAGFDFGNGAGTPGNFLIDDIVYNIGFPSPSTFSINNLTPGAAYDLYLYGDAAYNIGTTSFTIGATTLTTTGRSGGANASGTPSFWVSGTDYALFQTVVANGSGQIAGSWNGAAGHFSGIQIQDVPEPGIIALLALGGAFLMARRKR